MQSLWSRAKPKLSSYYRRCRCFTCLARPSEAAVLRRPTTTINLSSWNSLTTVSYFSLICTAACLDAGSKKKRRKGLDNAIEKVEVALAAGQKRQASQLAALSVEAREDVDSAPDTFIPSERPEHAIDHEYAWELGEDAAPTNEATPHTTRDTSGESVFDFGEARDRREEVIGLIGGRMAQSRALNNSPTSAYAASDVRGRKRSWTPKKLVTMEYSMAKLATVLLLEAELLSMSAGPSGGCEAGIKLRQKLMQLDHALHEGINHEDAMDLQRIPRLASPRYFPNSEDELETVQSLNVAMSTLLSKGMKGDLPPAKLFSSIANNLLISPAPPSVSTLTALIGGFSKMRQYGMAEAALEAVFEANMRVDEVTVHAMLAHFLRKNDYHGFHYIFKKMEGFHGGLMLANPATRNEKAGTRVRYWRRKAIQSIRYDAAIYKALISGYLRFDRPELARSLHVRMLADGTKPDVELLSEYLAHYTRTGEYIDGPNTLDSLQAQVLDSNSETRIIRGSREHMAIRHMLQYCKASYATVRHAEIYRAALARGLPIDALLPKALPLRHATANPALTALQRRVRILVQMGEQHAADVQVWALQVLAARMITAGQSVKQVREMFFSYSGHKQTVEREVVEPIRITAAQMEKDARLVQRSDDVEAEAETDVIREEAVPVAAMVQDDTKAHTQGPPEVIQEPIRVRQATKKSTPRVIPAPPPSLRRQWQKEPSEGQGLEVIVDYPMYDTALAPVAG